MTPRRHWWLPSIEVSLWLAFFLALCLSNWRLVLISADGDPCLHRRIGEWMLEHRAVLRSEQFSHTRDQAPLISKEWLSEVIYAVAGRAGHWNGFVLLAAGLIATTLWLLFRTLRSAGTGLLLAVGLVLAAAMASSMHWLARPHLTTHLLTVVFVWQLREFDRDQVPARRLWVLFPPLMLLWTNLHGAFFTGFVLLGLFFLGALWPFNRQKATTLAGVGLACLGASFVNPNTWGLHWQVVEFLRTPELAGMANEFRSPNFHSGGTHGFLLLLLLLGLTLLIVRPRWRFTDVLLVGVWGYFALHSVRNIPIFAIVLTPILAGHLQPWLDTSVDTPWRRAYRRWSDDVQRLDQRANGWRLVPAVIVVMVGLAHRPIWRTELLEDRFPVAAVKFIRENSRLLPGEMFNDYGWGGYLMWELPEHKVFMDGRNDFYGKAVVDDFNAVDDLQPGWEAVLDKYRVGWTLLPKNHKLHAVLALHTGWKQVYADSVAIIYTRRNP